MAFRGEVLIDIIIFWISFPKIQHLLKSVQSVKMTKISAVIIDTYADKKFASIAIKMVQRLPIVGTIFTLSDIPFQNVSGVEFIQIPPLQSINEYGKIIFERLPEIIEDDHVMVFQWDGFPLKPDQWTDKFLDYDYIGAIWPHRPLTPVGNGGFSIRSRKLLNTLKSLGITVDLNDDHNQPEDEMICIQHKESLEDEGIRFAPADLAAQFSFENGPLNKNTLGFHGPDNFPFFFTEVDLIKYSDNIILRISQPDLMLSYLFNCLKQDMHELLFITLSDFRNKPNLLKTYQFLSTTIPNSPLLHLFPVT